MLSITVNTIDNLAEITMSDKLKTQDFQALASHIEELIVKYGSVNLFIDMTDFHGWENAKAAEAHFGFIKQHHQNIERLAVIASHNWQHWLVAMTRVFVHPNIEVFESMQRSAAKEWLKNNVVFITINKEIKS